MVPGVTMIQARTAFRSLMTCVLFAFQAGAVEQPLELDSSARAWCDQAVRFAEQIADKALAEEVFYDLVRVQARAGDFVGASASAARVPYERDQDRYMYARVSVAIQAGKRGNTEVFRESLKLASEAALLQLSARPRLAGYLSVACANMLEAWGEGLGRIRTRGRGHGLDRENTGFGRSRCREKETRRGYPQAGQSEC
jgi:hypothetical protein